MNRFDFNVEGYTAKLRKHLSMFFKERGVESYYQKASDEAKFPYITYELRAMNALDDSNAGKRYIMEINAYNREKETILENLLDFLEQELDGFREKTPDMFFYSMLAYNRIDIEEDEPLKRKRVNYEINYWTKECTIR